MRSSVGKTKSSSDNCSAFLFAMFVMCCFLLLFSYTDSLTNINNTVHLTNTFFFDEMDDGKEFAVQRYTWKCEDKKCVRSVADNDVVSLNTCNMLCSQPSVWPKPLDFRVVNQDTSFIDKRRVTFNFSADGLVREMLQNSTEIFRQSLDLQQPRNPHGIELNVVINLYQRNVEKLRLATNESYRLIIEKGEKVEAKIFAETYFGARHALETLTQLIWYDDVADGLRILHDVDITDSPKFPHRGVSIDTARNYFPLTLIKKVVDGMSMAKLNVLHLHLTDAESFPIVLPRIKELASFGAYGPDMIYTPEDIQDLVRYALTRGIRVLLEIDAPGHVNAGWNFNRNEKYVICGEEVNYNGHLNPDNDNSLLILENIYRDLLDLSGNNEMFHLGSDEVNLTCWKNTAAAKNMNLQNNLKRFWAVYTNKILERLKLANNNTYPDYIVMWSSPLTESPEFDILDANVVVQHWLGDPSRILLKGHKVIYSTVGRWYLDCGFGLWKPSMKNGVCDPYTPWQTFYKHRPWIQFGHQELALGGEVCLWAEQVEVDTLETRIFPRSLAFAERIWSDPNQMNDYDVYTRLVTFVDRLKSKGIKSSGMWPRWCSQNPGKC